MANLNIDSSKVRSYDAIVIGSGIAGGWSAKELCEKGLKTLVLERGRDVQHVKDYPTTNMYPWQFEHRNEIPFDVKQENPVVSRCYAFREDAQHFFVKDTEHPYVQEKPFDWIRGYQVGGKSLLWARQTQRWSDFDFDGPARDGFAVDWPIRYGDLKPWYDHVERFAGISGNKDGLPELPDGEFLPGFPLNIVEKYFKEQVETKYPGRKVISARCAHLSKPNQIHIDQGRVQCQNRLLCQRGCPFGGYFSSNASTLPWAAKTGNLTVRPDSVVHSILYDDEKGKAIGVKVIDRNTKEEIDFYGKLIFVNAAALNSNLILLNSKSKRFPNGLGNDSETLGKYVAFHNYSARISAEYEGLLDYKVDGKNPAGGGYIPRFRNLHKQETDFLRGYAAGFGAYRSSGSDQSGMGEDLKNSLLNPKLGNWGVGSHMMGETIPKESNYVALDETMKDDWGIPQLKISVDYDDNDAKMKKDYLDTMEEMFTAAGFINIKRNESSQAPGLDIHEMGGVRMGLDPKTSMLNKWNQVHSCPNVFVTDGSCMTSTSTQNPSLTYMAFSARAVDYAVNELKKGNI
ncbi:GMC family oxidoreductase [Sphingobacterium sp. DK4209]|uniref:GMC family oxidoreductase n=1 Tax=Sphingobacterium zhuxiongii TaxID=2662364 RepID=A0A5Q0QCG5_9SPHI|nr:MULTISPECIES: GMC family oxidoreductase [unclassified Sphingobacterium]MVZ66020.1 GMC family oxidoreductase [Sphingobacterium sp. DK4209]QGA27525.1 GMC family oxidoreductase [Sphingobacterium sp. dk4302]